MKKNTSSKKSMPKIPLEERNTIAKNLVYLRKQRGYTQALVADRADISLRTLINAEVYGNPSSKTLKLLSQFYKIPVSVIQSDNFIQEEAQFYEFKNEALSYYLSASPIIETNAIIITDYINNYVFPIHRALQDFLRSIGYYIHYVYDYTYTSSEMRRYSESLYVHDLEIEHMKFYPQQENESKEAYKRRVKKYFDESMSIRTRKTSGNIDTSKRKFNDEMLPLVRNLQRNNEKRHKMLLDANIIVDKFNIILDEKIKAAKKKYKSKFDIEKFYLSTTDLEPLHLLINISFNIEQDTNQPLETLTIKEDPVVGTYTLEQYRDLLQHLFNEIKDIIQNFQK